jgi:putative FmdB family regulatory protein
MPTYDFRCTQCQHEFETQRTIAKRAEPLDEPCPSCQAPAPVVERMVVPVSSGDAVRLGRWKVTGGFRDVLERVKARVPNNRIDIR